MADSDGASGFEGVGQCARFVFPLWQFHSARAFSPPNSLRIAQNGGGETSLCVVSLPVSRTSWGITDLPRMSFGRANDKDTTGNSRAHGMSYRWRLPSLSPQTQADEIEQTRGYYDAPLFLPPGWTGEHAERHVSDPRFLATAPGRVSAGRTAFRLFIKAQH